MQSGTAFTKLRILFEIAQPGAQANAAIPYFLEMSEPVQKLII